MPPLILYELPYHCNIALVYRKKSIRLHYTQKFHAKTHQICRREDTGRERCCTLRTMRTLQAPHDLRAVPIFLDAWGKQGYVEITGVEVFHRYAALYTIASKLRYLLVDSPAITCRPISKIVQSKQNDQTRPRVRPGLGAAQRGTILHRFGPGHPSRSVVRQSVRLYRDRLHKHIRINSAFAGRKHCSDLDCKFPAVQTRDVRP